MLSSVCFGKVVGFILHVFVRTSFSVMKERVRLCCTNRHPVCEFYALPGGVLISRPTGLSVFSVSSW